MKWREWLKKNPDYYPEGITYDDYVDDYDESVSYFLEEEYWYIMGEGELGFEVHEPYGAVMYIGVSPTEIPDEMTMGDWKAKIEANLAKFCDEDTKVGWQEYAWRDG
jgi:hypothetical protein